MRSLFAVVLAAIVATPLLAQSNEISLLAGTSRLGTTDTGDSDVHFDGGMAYGVSYNRFWTSTFSTDFSAMRTSNDGSIRSAGATLLDAGSLDLTMYGATLQFHPLGHQKLDVYAGAGVANVKADDLESADLRAAGITNVHVGTRTTWLANVGAAIGIGRSFAVGVDGKYVRYRPSSASPGGEAVRLDLDPLILSLAVKFRF
jgi:outer membrane protein W